MLTEALCTIRYIVNLGNCYFITFYASHEYIVIPVMYSITPLNIITPRGTGQE